MQQSNLSELIQLDTINQIKILVNERTHLLHQVWTIDNGDSYEISWLSFSLYKFKIEFIRTQFEKQYNSLKNRLDETETQNERLTTQHRSATKQLLLYKNLVEAPENTNSPSKTKDFQQVKLTIDAVLKENERLYAEIHDFKTSDPVYEQVQLLETTNKHLKQELAHAISYNERLKQVIGMDEIKHLQLKLSNCMKECEQLRSYNHKLLNELQMRQHPSQISSSKQVCCHL